MEKTVTVVEEHTDFWNYPDWFGDTRDNLRSPGSEPFWMRPCAKPVTYRRHKGEEIEHYSIDRGLRTRLVRRNGWVEVDEELAPQELSPSIIEGPRS